MAIDLDRNEAPARGPWSIPEEQWDAADADLPQVLRDSIRIGRGVDGANDVAYVPQNKGQQATARLIAGAPDLLEAADEALNALIGCCVPAGGVDDRAAILAAQAKLRSALGKARG